MSLAGRLVYVVLGALLGTAFTLNANAFAWWHAPLFATCALGGTVLWDRWTGRYLRQLISHPVPPVPSEATVSEHFCRYCGKPADAVLRVVNDRPTSWVYYCREHVGAAVEALGLQARIARKRGRR
jgi:hypothetical protein